MEKPIMRAEDEERSMEYKMSGEQKKAVVVMAVIQLAMIVITAALLAAQLITSVKFGIGSIATIIIYLVIYLNYLKLAGYISDCGIHVKWVNIVKFISPIIYFLIFILCIITMA
jgi:hypothetical protein